MPDEGNVAVVQTQDLGKCPEPCKHHEEEIARLRAALLPFAALVLPKIGRFSAEVYSDEGAICISNGELTVGDLKRAARACGLID